MAEGKRHTFGDLIDRYEREVLPGKPKNAGNIKNHLAYWKECLGTRLLADVTPALIAEQRNALLATTTRPKKPISNATVVRYMASLSHAFTIAIKEWQWLDTSPMANVSKPKEPRGRELYLSNDERTRLLTISKASTSRCLYTVVVLALSTGMRRGEIMGLRWSQVDLQHTCTLA